MAQKRMIDKKISVSEQVAALGTEGALLFTWMIPHADDFGLLPSSPKTIKALVVPMLERFTVSKVGIQLESMQNQGLITDFDYNEKHYIRLTTFSKTQILKKDRQPNIILDLELTDEIKKNWKLCEEVMESKRNPIGTATYPEVKEEKGSKEKLSSVGEVKEGTSTEDGGGIRKLQETIKTLNLKN